MGAQVGHKLLLGHAQQVREMKPGTADGSFEGQQVRGSRILGQAVPGVCGSVGGRAQRGGQPHDILVERPPGAHHRPGYR